MFLIDTAGGYAMFLTERRRHSGNFTHHAGRTHHTHRAECHVAYADVASRHEKVVYVA